MLQPMSGVVDLESCSEDEKRPGVDAAVPEVGGARVAPSDPLDVSQKIKYLKSFDEDLGLTFLRVRLSGF